MASRRVTKRFARKKPGILEDRSKPRTKIPTTSDLGPGGLLEVRLRRCTFTLRPLKDPQPHAKLLTGVSDKVQQPLRQPEIRKASPAYAPGNHIALGIMSPCMHGARHAAGPSASAHVAFSGIAKPDIDDRTYEFITLSNQLDVLIVSDPKTDRSSASLDVHVGHLSDPEEALGLAHFLEHLLFLGTEKYPQENDYSKFLSDVGGGSSNAYTGVENTNYYFEVSSDKEAFEGALDRFAQFFIAPLFDESCTERELKAVDSEHKGNIQDDDWRLQYLGQLLSNPSHPYRKFGTGNVDTLKHTPEAKGIDIRRMLLDFHEKYYSANIMKLVVLGKEPMEVLTRWVIEKFSAIKNKGIAVPSYAGHPLSESELGKVIRVKPIKDIQRLTLEFPWPDVTSLYRTGPEQYIAHLLGHESEGSIMALLRERGWSTDLSAYRQHGGRNFDYFKMDIELSEEGLKHWEDVVELVFLYVKVLVEKGVQDWVYNECKVMSQLSFRYQEKFDASDFTSWVAQNMHIYEKEEILSGPYLMEHCDHEQIEKLMGLLRPDNFRAILVAPSHNTDEWATSPYYGTMYHVEEMSKTLTHRLQNLKLIPELDLPAPNPYLPSKFEVLQSIEVSEKPPLSPKIIRETTVVRLWYLPDTVYKVPRTSCFFLIRSPLAYATPRHAVLTKLYTLILHDALSEDAYMAELAELHYSLECLGEGILLCISGYTHKLPVFLKRIASTMVDLQSHVTPERFTNVLEDLRRQYKNFETDAAYEHAFYYIEWMLHEILWTPHEKLEELGSVSLEEVCMHGRSLVNPAHVEAFVHGAVQREFALKVLDNFEEELTRIQLRMIRASKESLASSLNGINEEFSETPAPLHKSLRPLPPSSRSVHLRAYILPPSTSLTYIRPLPNSADLNSAYAFYLQTGSLTSPHHRVLTTLFAHLLSEPCFDQLRTKEQLGYHVFSFSKSAGNTIGILIGVQSEKEPTYVEERVESLLERVREHLVHMQPAEFERQVGACRARLTQSDKNQPSTSRRLWEKIQDGSCMFDREMEDGERMKGVTREEILQFFDTNVRRGAEGRRKVALQIWSLDARKKSGIGEHFEGVVRHRSTALASSIVEEEKVAVVLEEREVIVPDTILLEAVQVAQLRDTWDLAKSYTNMIMLSIVCAFFSFVEVAAGGISQKQLLPVILEISKLVSCEPRFKKSLITTLPASRDSGKSAKMTQDRLSPTISNIKCAVRLTAPAADTSNSVWVHPDNSRVLNVSSKDSKGQTSTKKVFVEHASVSPVRDFYNNMEFEDLVDNFMAGVDAGLMVASVGKCINQKERTLVFDQLLRTLVRRLSETEDDLEVSMGYFGVTDVKVLNLLTERNVPASQVEEGMKGLLAPLEEVCHLLEGVLKQGCSLPHLFIFRMEKLGDPRTVSHFYLLDLGTPSFMFHLPERPATPGLPRTISIIRKISSLFAYNAAEGEAPYNESLLTTICPTLIGGGAKAQFILHVDPTDATAKDELRYAVDFVDMLRRVRGPEVVNLVDPRLNFSEQQCEDLLEELKNVETMLAEQAAEVVKLQAEIEAKELEKTLLDKEHLAATHRLEQSHSSVLDKLKAKVSKDLEGLRRELERAEKREADAKEQLEQLGRDLELAKLLMEDKLGQTGETISQLQESLRSQKIQTAHVEDRLWGALKEGEDLRSALTSLESDLDATKGEKETLEVKLEVCEKRLEDTQGRLRQVEAEFEATKESLDSSNFELVVQKATLEGEVASLNAELQSVRHVLEERNAELKKTQKELNRVEKELERRKVECEELREERECLLEDLAESKKQRERFRKREEMVIQEDTAAVLEETRRQAEREIEKVRREMRLELQRKVSDLEGKVQDSVEDLLREKEENRKLKRVVEAGKRALEESARAIEVEKGGWEVEKAGLQRRVDALENRLQRINGLLPAGSPLAKIAAPTIMSGVVSKAPPKSPKAKAVKEKSVEDQSEAEEETAATSVVPAKTARPKITKPKVSPVAEEAAAAVDVSLQAAKRKQTKEPLIEPEVESPEKEAIVPTIEPPAKISKARASRKKSSDNPTTAELDTEPARPRGRPPKTPKPSSSFKKETAKPSNPMRKFYEADDDAEQERVAADTSPTNAQQDDDEVLVPDSLPQEVEAPVTKVTAVKTKRTMRSRKSETYNEESSDEEDDKPLISKAQRRKEAAEAAEKEKPAAELKGRKRKSADNNVEKENDGEAAKAKGGRQGSEKQKASAGSKKQKVAESQLADSQMTEASEVPSSQPSLPAAPLASISNTVAPQPAVAPLPLFSFSKTVAPSLASLNISNPLALGTAPDPTKAQFTRPGQKRLEMLLAGQGGGAIGMSNSAPAAL
ncbi:Insulinase (Peptidase M16) [Chytridiales sp. JEL 0842]|nr:Insulinase (Peptidase M16) [Chytridiales sp. JEL 0842]